MQEPISPDSKDSGGFRLTSLKSWLKPDEMPGDLDLRTARRDIFRIVLPAAMELILVSLTSMVDMMMVGDLGTWAVSSVGLTGQPKFILQALILATNTGVTALVARAKGAQNYKETNSALRHGLMITMIMGILMSIIRTIL